MIKQMPWDCPWRIGFNIATRFPHENIAKSLCGLVALLSAGCAPQLGADGTIKLNRSTSGAYSPAYCQRVAANDAAGVYQARAAAIAAMPDQIVQQPVVQYIPSYVPQVFQEQPFQPYAVLDTRTGNLYSGVGTSVITVTPGLPSPQMSNVPFNSQSGVSIPLGYQHGST
jgi:hypothetical protein